VVFYELAKMSDIATDRGRLVVVDDEWIGLFKTEQQIFAVDAKCPHAGANLAGGAVCDGILSCPVHLWKFRLSDGKYLDADVPELHLKTYRVSVDEDRIMVDLSQQPQVIRLI